MPFTIVCAGSASTITLVEADGTTYTLTPDAHAASILFSTKQPRVAVFPGGFVLANCPSKTLWIDTLRARVFPVSVPPPTNPPVVSDGATSTFIGGDTGVRISNIVKDADGVLLAESPMGPEGRFTVTALKKVAFTLDVADEQWITGRRVYRADGASADYFHWLDIDDNVTTSWEDGTALESLSTVAAPDYAQAPVQLSIVVEHKGRLWGVSPAEPDTLFATDAGLFYSWPLEFPIRPVQSDAFGVTGMLARRNELGVLRSDVGWIVLGDAPTNFRVDRAFEGQGCVSADTCLVIKDIGYWLSPDNGCFSWSNAGVQSITDEKVAGWFTTGTYFNRAQFGQAWAAFDPINNAYVLFLCSAGSTTIDRWVAYYINQGVWIGPHKTALTNPRGAAEGTYTDGTGILQIGGSDGSLYCFTPLVLVDGASTTVDFDVTTKSHTLDPDKEHYFGELSTFVKAASGTLTITPSVGSLEASAGAAISHDTTLERKRNRRLGQGNFAKLNFRMNTSGKGVHLRGYEIDPVYVVGKR